jgi:hypothetical protein
MSGRARKPRISYAEISSDEDGLGSDSEEGASGGTSGSVNKGKGRGRKTAGDSYGAGESRVLPLCALRRL